MEPLTGIGSWIVSRWRIGALLACGVVVASLYKLSTETDEVRAQRANLKRENELLKVASRISKYALDVHRRHPDGDVIVSDTDLAKQLRKPQEIIASALGVLSDQKRVQRAPLAGYWKLNV
jgi:indole-3-glycerol phosphate synthase